MDLEIDYKSAIPVYEQIKKSFKMAILSGQLKKGDQAPSVRELSAQLKVSQNTVLKAYFQLDQECFLESKPGKGYFICWNEEDQGGEYDQLLNAAVDELIISMGKLGYGLEDIIEAIKERRDIQTKK